MKERNSLMVYMNLEILAFDFGSAETDGQRCVLQDEFWGPELRIVTNGKRNIT
jgi:hypothetical protein